MKRSELKTILKPLITQCVKEVLLEEGVLSGVVAEVVRGVSPVLTEGRQSSPPDNSKQQALLEQQRRQVEEEKHQRLKEQKRKVLDATGFGSEIFEGVKPLTEGGDPGSGPTPGALAGTDPSDAGVDISGIMALGGNKWKNLV
jgi:hypothetical protein